MIVKKKVIMFKNQVKIALSFLFRLAITYGNAGECVRVYVNLENSVNPAVVKLLENVMNSVPERCKSVSDIG